MLQKSDLQLKGLQCMPKACYCAMLPTFCQWYDIGWDIINYIIVDSSESSRELTSEVVQ